MKDIRIYDFSFNLLHIEHNIMSAFWTIYYNAIGTFEGVIPLKDDTAKVFLENDYLFLVQGDLQAIVTGKVIGKTVKIYGKTPNWILTKRSVGKFSKVTSYEIVVKDMLSEGFSDIFAEAFTFCNKAGEKEEREYSCDTRKTVFDAISERLSLENLGHRVFINVNTKKWEFEIFEGKEIGYELSEKDKNLKDVTISDNLAESFTSGYFKKPLLNQGKIDPNVKIPGSNPDRFGEYYTIKYEGTAQVGRMLEGGFLVCSDKNTGAFEYFDDLPELWDYIDGEKTGMKKWDGVFSVTTKEEAESELLKHSMDKKITAETARFKFNENCDIGDTVCIAAQKGNFSRKEQKRISGVEIWFESGNCGEKLIFEEDKNGI